MRFIPGAAAVAALTLVLVGLPLVSPGAAAAANPDRFGEYSPIMIVLDTSGSMSKAIGGVVGETGRRMDAAQAAILDLLPHLSKNRAYGMLAFPGRDAPTVDGCSIGRVETPLAKINLSDASSAVRRMNADGGTPTGPALLNAGGIMQSQFGDSVNGVIVLVSDGESNCGTPPCEVARSLRANGLEVQINTVGLNLEGSGADEMKCIADATGGRYVPVTDKEGLQAAINAGALAQLALTVSAPKAFAVVSGTGAAGGGSISVTVTSSGRTPAADVRVSAIVSLDNAGPGSVLVPKPVRFIGNLGVGLDARVDFDVRPDDQRKGTAKWSVTVTARNAAPQFASGEVIIRDTIGVAGLGPLFEGVTRVAVLGDSYSSGEGASGSILNDPLGYYTAESDGRPGSNACHRSSTTYAQDIFGVDNVDLIACSGAVTPDLLGSQQSGDPGTYVRPQLEQLATLMRSPRPPGAVFITIGGNDAGFGDIVGRCVMGGAYFGLQPGGAVFGHDCALEASIDQKGIAILAISAIERAFDVQNDVRNSLKQVDAVANSPAAIASRGGKVAPIVLLPYPRIIPNALSASETPDGCSFGLSGQEIVFLNRYFTTLNTSVSLAAYSLRSAGRPVYVATDVEGAFQPDHTICEGGDASYAVFVTAGTALTHLKELQTNKAALLHPNVEGHKAMARAIVAWSNSRAATPIQVTGTTATEIEVRNPPTVVASFFDNPLGGSLTIAGGAIHVVQKRLVPGSTIVIRLDSTPTTVGSAIVAADGTADTVVQLPADAPLGKHHLVVFGIDEQGHATVRSSDLTVIPAGGTWLIIIASLGALFAILGAAGVILGYRGWRLRRLSP